MAVLLAMAAVLFFRGRPAALPTTTKPSIAALPFTNLRGNKDQEYVPDGRAVQRRGLRTKVKERHGASREPAPTTKGSTDAHARRANKAHGAEWLGRLQGE